MSCEKCRYRQALGVAEEIVNENPNNLFDSRRKEQKLAELAVVEMIFDAVQPYCRGERKDGRCGQAVLVNDARSFIFGNPEVHISANNQRTMGFSNE